jgi:apolipoprotein D and lipocalin family protein
LPEGERGVKRLAVLALLLLGACAAPPPAGPPVQTVASVDLQRYLGTWYEIARLPNSFQDGGSRRCVETTATYALRPDGQVGVTNRCVDAGAGNAEAVATARAYAVEGSGNARLRVTFFWPFYGDYWVIGLDPEYRWAVVGTPSRNFLWVLSRTPRMTEADHAAALGIAAAQGFDTARLQPTPQLAR